MMLPLLVAGLVIGCSSAPLPTHTPYPTYPPAATSAPATPVANLTEKEAIGIARSANSKGLERDKCWDTKKENHGRTTYSNFTHTESASFKPSGIWIVTAENSWTETEEIYNPNATAKQNSYVSFLTEESESCTVVVDDSTGEVKTD